MRLGQAFWGHITHFWSRVPPASCTCLGLLLLPERLIGPELDQHRALPSISAEASPTRASPTVPKQWRLWVRLHWYWDSQHHTGLLSRLLKQVYVHVYSYICFRSLHEHTGCTHTYIEAHHTAGGRGRRRWHKAAPLQPCTLSTLPLHCSDPGVCMTSAPPPWC